MFKALEKIAKTNSNKEKAEILKNHDSVELREYLDIGLNIYRVYYVNKMPKERIEGVESFPIPGKGFTKFKFLVKALEQRQISGHIALNTIHDVFSTFTKQERKWFTAALAKKAIGVGPATVNAAFGKNTIPSFKVMLADNKQPDLDKITYPKWIKPKIDGFRAVWIPNVGFIGRNGKPIRNSKLNTHFKGLAYEVKGYVLDGELDSTEWHGQADSFNKITSILNSEDKDVPEHIRYTVYDCIPLADWTAQAHAQGYAKRMEEVPEIILNVSEHYPTTEDWFSDDASFRESYSPVVEIPSIPIKNRKELDKWYKYYLNSGYEGIMIKDLKAPYHWKRVSVNSQVMLKLKPSITHDLKVTGFEEGEGKFKGMLGKLLVDFNGVEVGVGTGLTEANRVKIWSNKKAYLGQIAEVKGMEVTADGSIRHPVFVRWRKDK